MNITYICITYAYRLLSRMNISLWIYASIHVSTYVRIYICIQMHTYCKSIQIDVTYRYISMVPIIYSSHLHEYTYTRIQMDTDCKYIQIDITYRSLSLVICIYSSYLHEYIHTCIQMDTYRKYIQMKITYRYLSMVYASIHLVTYIHKYIYTYIRIHIYTDWYRLIHNATTYRYISR